MPNRGGSTINFHSTVMQYHFLKYDHVSCSQKSPLRRVFIIFILQKEKPKKRKVKQFVVQLLGQGLSLENTDELGLGLAVLLGHGVWSTLDSGAEARCH